jgi:hypothetical protein
MSTANTNEPVPALKAADWLVRFIVPLWILTGAGFKYLAGSVSDLPPIYRFMPGAKDPGVLQQAFLITVAIELLIVVLLLTHRRYARALAIGVLSVFCVVLIDALAFGSASCGCFGSVKVSPWVMLGIDVALLAGAIFLPGAKAIPDIGNRRWIVITLLSAALIVAVFGGVDRGYQGRFSSAQTLDLHRWMGRSWEQLAIFNFTPRAADGRLYSPATFPEDRQIWVFYRRTCPHCFDTIQALSEAKQDVKTRLVVVDLPMMPGVEEALKMQPFEAPCSACDKLRLIEGIQYEAPVPVVVTFQRGVVIDIRVGK